MIIPRYANSGVLCASGTCLAPTEAERRKDCGSATHGTIRRHHSWGLLTPTSFNLFDFQTAKPTRLIYTRGACSVVGFTLLLFYILAVRNVKITLLHGNLDLVAFDSHYAALVISVSGYPWTADDFIAIFF